MKRRQFVGGAAAGKPVLDLANKELVVRWGVASGSICAPFDTENQAIGECQRVGLMSHSLGERQEAGFDHQFMGAPKSW